ncbi:hypothetical protein REPUB_Repub17cG0060600 [Reevesia pubescens]
MLTNLVTVQSPSSTYDVSMGGFCATNFTSGPAAGKFCWDQQPDYCAFRESSFGHVILEVKNETWTLWTWYRNQDSNGKLSNVRKEFTVLFGEVLLKIQL